MQIKLQQSRAGPLICARSRLKFPKVLCDVHGAIRAKHESGWCNRGEESRALTDRLGCQLFTVKLILSSFPSAFDVAARLVLSVSLSVCPRLRKAQPKVVDKKQNHKRHNGFRRIDRTLLFETLNFLLLQHLVARLIFNVEISGLG